MKYFLVPPSDAPDELVNDTGAGGQEPQVRLVSSWTHSAAFARFRAAVVGSAVYAVGGLLSVIWRSEQRRTKGVPADPVPSGPAGQARRVGHSPLAGFRTAWTRD